MSYTFVKSEFVLIFIKCDLICIPTLVAIKPLTLVEGPARIFPKIFSFPIHKNAVKHTSQISRMLLRNDHSDYSILGIK